MPSSRALGVTLLGAGLLALAASTACAQQCYRADQQVNVRSKADICSSSKGSIQPGDVIRVSGSPQQTCYNWQAAEVVSGALSSAQGYFNLDALSPTSCPGGAPAPPSNAPCKNAGEQCYYDSECCQVGPGSGPPVRCQAPDNRGSPKVCSGGAVVSSVAVGSGGSGGGSSDGGGRPLPTGVATPTAVATPTETGG